MKAPIVPIIVVVIIAVALGAYFYYFGVPPQITSVQPTEEGGPATITGLDVARQTLDFVDSMKISDGVYYQYLECSTDGTECVNGPNEGVIENDFLYLAYSELAKSGDEQYSQLADQTFDKMLDICKPQGSCSGQGFMAIMDSYMKNGDPQLLDIMLQSKEGWYDSINTSTVALSISSQMLSMIYMLDKDPDTLEGAKSQLAVLSAVQDSDPDNAVIPGTSISKNGCSVQNTYIVLYMATGDQSHLEGPKALYHALSIGDNAARFSEVDTLLICMDSMIRMYDLTNEDFYKEEAEKIGQEVLRSYWDTDQNKKMVGGDGFVRLKDATGSNTKFTLDAILATIHFAKLHDSKFEVGA